MSTQEFIYLKAGDACFTRRPVLVETVLGSCVAVMMFNSRLGFGAICHVPMPESPDFADEECFKYADCSVRWMAQKFELAGSRRNDIKVKIFGGADVLSLPTDFAVGRQNVEAALRVIEAERLNLVASDTGGREGRKIFFYTHTGEVLVKKIKGYSGPQKQFGNIDAVSGVGL